MNWIVWTFALIGMLGTLAAVVIVTLACMACKAIDREAGLIRTDCHCLENEKPVDAGTPTGRVN